MAKKKTGSIALPYLITIFLGIIILGGGTFFTMRHFGILGGHKELKTPTPRPVTVSTYEDNHTILLILEEPEKKKTPYSFMLMRSIPKDKKLVFIGIPSNTIAVVNGGQQSLRSAYETGGCSSAVKFTEQIFGVDVDRYMKLNSESLVKIGDILGGVYYPISEDIAGFNGDGSVQFLNGEQIDKLVTYSMFKGGEVERAYIASSVIANMVNGADGTRVSGNLDSSFNTIVNMVDTNITAVDYKQHKVAIKNMFEYGSSIASYFTMDGERADEDFIPRDAFFKSIRENFFKDAKTSEDGNE